MRLAADWRRVLRHAWSIRFIIIAGLFNGASAAVGFLKPDLLPPRWWWVLPVAGFAIDAAAFWSRILAQKELSDGDQDQGSAHRRPRGWRAWARRLLDNWL